MRMIEDYEAYFDDYDLINVYMKKTFYGGSSNSFHIKDSKERIIPLTILSKTDFYNGYTHYQLRIDGEITIGEEYLIFEEHAQNVYCMYSHIVKTRRFDAENAYDKEDLGLTYSPTHSVFKFWAPTANRIVLHLKNGKKRSYYDLHREDHGIFTVGIAGDLRGYEYFLTIRVNGKWNQCVDPYSSFSGPNSKYSVVESKDYLKFPDKIYMKPLNSNTDAVIYEVNIRDMTSQKDIGVRYPKTFVGFTEENEETISRSTGFSYLKSLGATHIQIMPVFDFGSVDDSHPNLYYNWGYDPMQYRCFEGTYSTDCTDAAETVLEFAEMIYRCHKSGLRVNLDLVFNHVYNKSKFALEAMVPNYYFLMNTEGEFSNGSFCGNDIDTRPIMARRYFIDTCKRIIQWFDVDGFRFDLMGILDYQFMNMLASECTKLKPGFMLYGEGWNMASFVPEDLRASQNNQAKMDKVGHFSDRFREAIKGSTGILEQRGYIGGNVEGIETVKMVMAASCLDHYFSTPQKVINYVECHDNHTLWDKNEVACKFDSVDVRKKRQVLANAMVLLAQGVPFLHAGQEFCRTKLGLGNSYNRPDFYNRIDYNRRDEFIDVVYQTKKLIQIRKAHPCFRLRHTEEIEKNVSLSTIEDIALVYKTEYRNDRCVVFFNPTDRTFRYNLHENAEVIFDNGLSNALYTESITIAPYSVVICQM